jgi:hypothetical protein
MRESDYWLKRAEETRAKANSFAYRQSKDRLRNSSGCVPKNVKSLCLMPLAGAGESTDAFSGLAGPTWPSEKDPPPVICKARVRVAVLTQSDVPA